VDVQATLFIPVCAFLDRIFKCSFQFPTMKRRVYLQTYFLNFHLKFQKEQRGYHHIPNPQKMHATRNTLNPRCRIQSNIVSALTLTVIRSLLLLASASSLSAPQSHQSLIQAESFWFHFEMGYSFLSRL
jgi:hypothetical protein